MSQITPSTHICLRKAQAPLILLQFPCIGYWILLYSPSTFPVFPNEKVCTYFDEGQSLRSLRHDWFLPALRSCNIAHSKKILIVSLPQRGYRHMSICFLSAYAARHLRSKTHSWKKGFWRVSFHYFPYYTPLRRIQQSAVPHVLRPLPSALKQIQLHKWLCSWISVLLFLRLLGVFTLFSSLLSLFHVNPSAQVTPSAHVRLNKAQAPIILLKFPCIAYRILLYSLSTFPVW